MKSTQDLKKEGLKYLFNIKWDSSAYFLIVVNIIIIIIAIIKQFDFLTLLFIYWCQSVIIGLFNFIRIFNLKNFTTENIEVNNQKIKPTKASRNFIAFFFLFHYGFFHVIYLMFLMNNLHSGFLFILPISLSVGLFFLNHLFSFIKNFKQDTEKKQDLGKVMIFPYARIIPMHFSIILGFGFLSLFGNGDDSIMIIFFLILKTVADVVMHNREHRD